MRYYLSIIVCKIIDLIAKLIRGEPTHKAGKIALKIYPDLLKRIEKPKKIVGITGTNGKTTVTNLVSDALNNLGYKFIHNKEGANIEDRNCNNFSYWC